MSDTNEKQQPTDDTKLNRRNFIGALGAAAAAGAGTLALGIQPPPLPPSVQPPGPPSTDCASCQDVSSCPAYNGQPLPRTGP